MSITPRIEQDLKDAMKSKDEQALSTLRLVRTALKNKQIDLMHPLTEDEEVAVVRTMLKQYRDALADFTAAGRQDLAAKQTAEIQILEKYLPPPMSDVELETICKRVIEETQATPKDLGKVMGLVMKEVGSRADGNAVRTVVQRLFSSLQT